MVAAAICVSGPQIQVVSAVPAPRASTCSLMARHVPQVSLCGEGAVPPLQESSDMLWGSVSAAAPRSLEERVEL